MSTPEHESEDPTKEFNYNFKFHVYNIGDVRSNLLRVRDGETRTPAQYNCALFMQVASHFEKKGYGIATMNYSFDSAVLYVAIDDEAWAEGAPTKLEIKN